MESMEATSAGVPLGRVTPMAADLTPVYAGRLEIRPGLTGWAQVQGRASLPWADRIELDVWYVDHRSPRVDLEILLRTPLALFRGTYRGATGGWR